MRHPALSLSLLATLLVGCWTPAPETPLARGKVYFNDGEWDLALSEFDQAIAINPLDAEAFLYRGQTYMCRGREHVGQAIADYTEAIRLHPQGYEAYYHRAIAYRERGEKQKALADELVARRLDPNAEKAALMRSAPTPEEYKAAFERAAKVEDVGEDGKTSDAVLGSIPDLKPKAASQHALVEADRDSTTPGVGLSGRPTAEGAAPTPYGLPVPNFRIGSMTEELMDLEERGSDSPEDRDLHPRGLARRRQPAADWQSAAPPLTQPGLPASQPAAPHRSPVGTLPFGNPFQPHTSGYSPYSTGPRSTGIQSNPAVPNQGYRSGAPYRGGVPYYGNRGFDPNAVQPGPGR